MHTIAADKSISRLRMGEGVVMADRDLASALDTGLSRARLARMDGSGSRLHVFGLRETLRGAMRGLADAGVVTQDSARQSDAILNKILAARQEQGAEGRLDSKRLGITSDRLDSSNQSAAIAFARELEYVYNEVVREERPVLSARRLFEIDRSVPAGAKTHTIRRIQTAGEATWWRGGKRVPFVSMGRDEETFPVRHAVIGLEADFFSLQASDYAGISEWAEKARAAQEVMAEFENAAFWFGDDSVKLYGILNYPWLRRRLISTTFGAVTTDAAFQTVLDALNDMVNEVVDQNPGAAYSLDMTVSPGMIRYMGQTRHPTSQRTLRELFEAGQPNLTLREAPELQGAGPNGEDGFLITPKGSNAPKLVVPTEFSMMPVQISDYGMSRSQIGWMSIGGAVMRGVLRSVLVWATRS